MENRNTQRNTSHWSKARAHNILNPHMASPLGFEHRPNWCPVRDAAATPPWGGARSVVDRGGGGVSGFQVSGMIEGFFGVGKFWQVFFWVA